MRETGGSRSPSFSSREKVAVGRMRVPFWPDRKARSPSSAASRHLLPGGEGIMGDFAILRREAGGSRNPSFSLREKVAGGRMRVPLWPDRKARSPSSAASRHLLPGGEGIMEKKGVRNGRHSVREQAGNQVSIRPGREPAGNDVGASRRIGGTGKPGAVEMKNWV